MYVQVTPRKLVQNCREIEKTQILHPGYLTLTSFHARPPAPFSTPSPLFPISSLFPFTVSLPLLLYLSSPHEPLLFNPTLHAAGGWSQDKKRPPPIVNQTLVLCEALHNIFDSTKKTDARDLVKVRDCAKRNTGPPFE